MTLSTTTWRLSSSTGTCWVWKLHCGKEAHSGAARPTGRAWAAPRDMLGAGGGQSQDRAQGSSTVAVLFPPDLAPTPSWLGHPRLGRAGCLDLCSTMLALFRMKVPRAVEAQGQAVVDFRPLICPALPWGPRSTGTALSQLT